MSLSSSLYTGTSGLSNMSSALQVTSNNIANTNTVGFKKGEATFADTLYQTVGTMSGASQVGLGMSINTVSQNFTEGAFETTGNSTDLAIGGDGFFVVSQPGSEEVRYTRAGNFSFDESGALTTPDGYIVQGWYVDPETGDATGAVTDLVLTEFTSAPEKTDEITVVTNLSADGESNSEVLSNVYAYEDGETSSVYSDTYEYQSVITTYDSLGSPHELTVYYDKKSDTEWEYIIVANAEEDKRNLTQNTGAQGLLARGTIEFSESSGEIVNMTMEEFTGRIGNVETTGMNEMEDVHFSVEDSQAMLLDGYGIEMSYDGDQWELDQSTLPEAYKDAEIVYSDSQNVYLVLDPESSGGEEEPDLKIKLDEYAMAGDTITFDINDVNDLHVQDVKDVSYEGDTANNTSVGINDPSVMDKDAEGLSLVWNPTTETWHWSNPQGAADAGTLVSEVETSNTAAVNTTAANIDITNAEDLISVSDDVSVKYNAATGEWDWNEPLKTEDFTDPTNTLETETDITMELINAGGEGAMATQPPITVEWDGTQWVVQDDGGLNVSVVAGESDASKVRLEIYDADPTKAATVEYSFEDPISNTPGQTLSFDIDPTPPAEYANAQIMTTADNSLAIDFNGNSSVDLTMNVTSGATTALAGGETLTFNLDPDTPPAEYENAVVSGDATRAVIDLDGSGGEDDREDIVFTFEEEMKSGPNTHPLEHQSTISFDISGSTAWRTCETEEAESTGYYQFTTDFLGGEFGSTETDISFNIGSQFDGNNWQNDSLSTTQYARASSTTYQDADGYPPGDLTGVEVSADGVMTGNYSNGQQLDLFQVALADFTNPNGLHIEGGNMYSATLESGAAITNKPGENGLGEVASYTLEMSNVDISEEFVEMIEYQNGYEANAKIISTVDEMMSTVISMKR